MKNLSLRKLSNKLISFYQIYSSTREPRCKFYPSCSNYAATAISRYGFKGLLKSIWRLLRCHPWSDGGIDYVDYELDSSEARNLTLNSNKTREGVR